MSRRAVLLVVEHGPHPDLDSVFEAFCEVISEALG
jgi:hypothetical protein